jgi:hypothetical protein
MLWMPAVSLVVVQVAVRLLPLPLSAAAEQPAIDVSPSRKFTVPVCALPVTVAVNVTLSPALAGLSELDSVVLVAAPLTVCVSTALVEAASFASPL